MEQKDNITVLFRSNDQIASDSESFYITSEEEDVVGFVELTKKDLENIWMVQDHIRDMEKHGVQVNHVAITGRFELAEGASCECGSRIGFTLWQIFNSYVVVQLTSKYSAATIEWQMYHPELSRAVESES